MSAGSVTARRACRLRRSAVLPKSGYGRPRQDSRSFGPRAERRLDAPAHLAERVASQDHLVAVLEEGAGGAVRQLDRLGPVPAQFDQAAALVALGAGDGARREQVARAHARAVDGQMGNLLRDGPVEMTRIGAGHLSPVQLDLQCNVVGPRLLAQVLERLRLLRLARDSALGQLVQ